MSIKNRGFASMSKERRTELARLGGIAAHAQGTAHEFDSYEAGEAGRLGGIENARRWKERKANRNKKGQFAVGGDSKE